jgi:hypothetical protein
MAYVFLALGKARSCFCFIHRKLGHNLLCNLGHICKWKHTLLQMCPKLHTASGLVDIPQGFIEQ